MRCSRRAMSCRRCSVSGSIDSASISFSRMPIGSSNSSSSGMAISGSTADPALRTAAPRRRGAASLGRTRICGVTSALTRSCLAGAYRLPARWRRADRLGWPRAGPTRFELLARAVAVQPDAHRLSRAAPAGCRAERSRSPACATIHRHARIVRERRPACRSRSATRIAR